MIFSQNTPYCDPKQHGFCLNGDMQILVSSKTVRALREKVRLGLRQC